MITLALLFQLLNMQKASLKNAGSKYDLTLAEVYACCAKYFCMC